MSVERKFIATTKAHLENRASLQFDLLDMLQI